MPMQKKSAAKRMRQNVKRHASNVAVRTEIKSERHGFFAALAAKDVATADKLYREYCSLLDKSAKKGVIGRNTAGRRKARASRLLVALKK